MTSCGLQCFLEVRRQGESAHAVLAAARDLSMVQLALQSTWKNKWNPDVALGPGQGGEQAGAPCETSHMLESI